MFRENYLLFVGSSAACTVWSTEGITVLCLHTSSSTYDTVWYFSVSGVLTVYLVLCSQFAVMISFNALKKNWWLFCLEIIYLSGYSEFNELTSEFVLQSIFCVNSKFKNKLSWEFIHVLLLAGFILCRWNRLMVLMQWYHFPGDVPIS